MGPGPFSVSTPRAFLPQYATRVYYCVFLRAGTTAYLLHVVYKSYSYNNIRTYNRVYVKIGACIIYTNIIMPIESAETFGEKMQKIACPYRGRISNPVCTPRRRRHGVERGRTVFDAVVR